MPIATDEVSKEIRGQRQQFIIEYYKMSVADLDRHLKVSWQTIAAVAGGVASISLAQEGKLVPPFAISAALIVAFWGLWNIVDGNYWAVRAIAFLSNVEATYFAEQDRRHFNPYAGHHPPFKLLDSLRYQFLAVVLFTVLVICYFGWRVFGQGYSVFSHKLAASSLTAIGFWMIPVLIVAFAGWYTVYIWLKRINDYYHFVSGSPGPGMVATVPVRRSIEYVIEAPDVAIVSGDEIQRDLLNNLRQLRSRWTCIYRWTTVISPIVVLAVVAVVIYFRLRGP